MNSEYKIALIGYGKIGQIIEKIAKSEGLEIVEIFDESRPLKAKNNYSFETAIDFSTPAAVVENTKIVAESGKNLVIGTTGWYKNIDLIKEIAEKNNTGIVWGANFSIGMQMFFKLVNLAAELVNSSESYDIFMHELHHKRKLDSPSGTSLAIAEIIKKSVKSKKENLVETAHGEISDDQLHVSSTRGGFIPGTHTIYLDSEADTIELTHRARNRTGFADGAILAAKLIREKKGFYSFEELLDRMWKNGSK